MQDGDTFDIVDLADAAPGAEIIVVLKHTGGNEDRIQTRHTLSAEQFDWFKAGSALNLIAQQSAGD